MALTTRRPQSRRRAVGVNGTVTLKGRGSGLQNIGHSSRNDLWHQALKVVTWRNDALGARSDRTRFSCRQTSGETETM